MNNIWLWLANRLVAIRRMIAPLGRSPGLNRAIRQSDQRTKNLGRMVTKNWNRADNYYANSITIAQEHDLLSNEARNECNLS